MTRQKLPNKGGRYIDRRIALIKKSGSIVEKRIAELAGETGHKTLAVWACDCADRVLPYFEKQHPKDDRPRMAIEAGRTWARTGAFRMADVRRHALAAHAAARDARDAGQAAACFAARAAGHAVATAHVDAHALGGADYAIKAIAAVDPVNAEANTAKERAWQHHHLQKRPRKAHDFSHV